MSLYHAKYEGRYYVEVGTYGDGKKYKIELPTPPPKAQMKNADKPISEQFFEYEKMPNWSTMKKREADLKVKELWHKRRHGEWWLIKGRPLYLTGKAWTYINFWTPRKGGRIEFRYTDLEWFWIWDMIERNPKCLGLFELKPRRIGETEKILFTLWEYASRVRTSHCGIMSKTDADAKKNYSVLAKANAKIPFFFKPVNRGSNVPQHSLEFSYPEVRHTIESVRENKAEAYWAYPALESIVDYKATVLGAYDGEAIHRGYWDEVGKVPVKKVDIESQIGVLAECATESVGTKIVGKLILASTMEDMDEGKQNREYRDNVRLAQAIWDGSNPEEVNPETGMTSNGFFRLFRSYENGAPVDKYGFPIVEEAKKKREATIKDYERLERWEQLTRYKRKYPANEREALMPSVEDCDLHPELIDRRIAQIKLNLGHDGSTHDDNGNEYRRKSVIGNLEWVDGFGSTVEWQPTSLGRWEISQHPAEPNKKVFLDGRYAPGNRTIFKTGVDPIGTKTDSKYRSEGGIAVFRSFDLMAERMTGKVDFDDDGVILNPWNMVTDQFVCTYSYRHDNPYYFFEDCLKTLIYYGSLGHLEESVQYVENAFRDNGFEHWLQMRPRELGGSKKRLQTGTKASTSVIETYVTKLKAHVFEKWYLYNHLNLLEDMRLFNVKNRGKRDLTVAAGYALLADMDGRLKIQTVEDSIEEGFHYLYDRSGQASGMNKYLGGYN